MMGYATEAELEVTGRFRILTTSRASGAEPVQEMMEKFNVDLKNVMKEQAIKQVLDMFEENIPEYITIELDGVESEIVRIDERESHE